MRKKRSRYLRKTKYILYKETLINGKEMFWSFCGAFVGLLIIGWLQYEKFSHFEQIFLIGSFGATCVLIYGAVDSPLAQPRNLIGGHLISAVIGVTAAKLLPEYIFLTAPLAVSLSIIAMQWTKTLHPPGGATALIAVSDMGSIKALGYGYVFSPVLSGVLILLIVALIFNNITPYRQYPKSIRKYPIIRKMIFWKSLP